MTEESVAATIRGPSQSATAFASPALIDMDGLSYEEYFKKVEELRENLIQNWELNQRVKAFKIAIQLAKLLADTGQLKLYARKFKMITNIMDEFGQLVATRIDLISRGQQHLVVEQRNLRTIMMEPMEEAKKTCKNWFLKVASIRELLPRFYTELAILKTCDTLFRQSSSNHHYHASDDMTNEQFYFQSLKRLTKSTWGFGDPLVALNARAYLCRVAQKLIKFNDQSMSDCILFELILMNLEGAAIAVSRIDPKTVATMANSQHIETSLYFELMSSALRNIISGPTIRYDLSEDRENLTDVAKEKLEILYQKLLEQVDKNHCSVISKCILLNATLRALPGDIIANHASELLNLFKLAHKSWAQPEHSKMETQLVSTPALYYSLESFALALDSSESFDRCNEVEIELEIFTSLDLILDELFNCSSTITTSYLNCFKSWLSYGCHYLDHSTIDKMLNKFVQRMKKHCSSIHEQYMVLLDIVKIVVANNKTIVEFEQTFKMKGFREILSLFRKDEHIFEVNKWILETVRSNLKLLQSKQAHSKQVNIESKVMINFLLCSFAQINDSINLLMASDDVKQLALLVIYFLDRISPNLDFRGQLELYSKCRANVCNLNPVLEHLARATLVLPYNHMKLKPKTASNYLATCLAFTFVTVPAVHESLTRLEIFIEGSQLALRHMSLSLADYYIKQTISTLLGYIQPPKTVNVPAPPLRQPEEVDTVVDGFHDTKATRLLLNHVTNLVNMVLACEEHIDLKHKLALVQIIRSFFNKHSQLVEKVALMNIMDNDDDDDYVTGGDDIIVN